MTTLLKAKPGARAFYDAWESKSEDARRRAIGLKLKDYIRFAARNVPFYRERLSAFDPKAEHPLAKIPVLGSEDLRGLVPPASLGLLSTNTGDYNVFQSGGTTGFPKTALFSHSEMEALDLPNARGFYALGLKKEDRVGNLFAVGALYMTFIHINRMLQQYGCMNFPFTNYAPADFMHMVMRRFNINCIAGVSSIILDRLREMKKMGLEGIKIEKIFYGGEHLYEADKQELREDFGVSLVAAPGYGTIDSWYIGYQCLSCPTGVFHTHDDQCFLEIVDEETGRPCPPGKAGMTYATTFPRRLTPIVRYRVGDRALWIKKPCPCGRTTPLFRLLGRGDDVLRVGYDSFDYGSLLEAVGRVPGLSGTVQMQKTRERGRDRLTVRVETEAPRGQHPKLAEALAREIPIGRPALRKCISEKTIWPFKIELLKPGSISRNPRTGKLIRVLDVI